MSAVEAEAPAAAETLDAELCFCRHVSREAFLEAVWSAPDTPFDELCRETGVGAVCTSCLLNAEDSYVFAATHRPPTPRAAGTRKAEAGLSVKRRLYRAIDALSPGVPVRLRGIAPLFAASDIQTIVSVANSVPEVIGARSSAFRVRIICRDAQGRVVATHDARLAVGERLDFDATEKLDRDGGSLVTGAAFVHILAENPGYRGTIRPHFRIVTPRGVSAVHTQGNGKPSGGYFTIVEPGERQYLSLVNCEQRAISAEIEHGPPGGERRTQTVRLAAFGAALIEVGGDHRAGGAVPTDVSFRADGPVRPHAIVAGGAPPRLSADHL